MARDDILTHAQRERAVQCAATKRTAEERDMWDVTGLTGLALTPVVLYGLGLDRNADVFVWTFAACSFVAYWCFRLVFDSLANAEREELRRLDDRELIGRLRHDGSLKARYLLREIGEDMDR